MSNITEVNLKRSLVAHRVSRAEAERALNEPSDLAVLAIGEVLAGHPAELHKIPVDQVDGGEYLILDVMFKYDLRPGEIEDTRGRLEDLFTRLLPGSARVLELLTPKPFRVGIELR